MIGITNDRDTTRSQTFGYDQVNRIVTAGTPAPCGANCWSQSFVYDQWANLTSATATGTAPPLTLAVNANNQVSTAGFTFDGAGNETHDATFAYVWNAESEIKTGGGINPPAKGTQISIVAETSGRWAAAAAGAAGETLRGFGLEAVGGFGGVGGAVFVQL
ncbi:MAG: hypothetical protein WA737_15400 [Candidatus Acidiferrales bacterium]